MYRMPYIISLCQNKPCILLCFSFEVALLLLISSKASCSRIDISLVTALSCSCYVLNFLMSCHGCISFESWGLPLLNERMCTSLSIACMTHWLSNICNMQRMLLHIWIDVKCTCRICFCCFTHFYRFPFFLFTLHKKQGGFYVNFHP